MAATVDSIRVGGLDIAYRRSGSGPALVLLHGALSDSRSWAPQLDGLADEFTVIAWDAPGCGGSADPPEDFGIAGYADSLAGFIDALGLDRPHVLGLSFGGGLAIALHQRHPQAPGCLVLASAYAGWAGSLSPAATEQRRERALRAADRPPEEWVDGFLPEFFVQGTPRWVLDETRSIMLETRPIATRVMAHAFADADLRDALPAIDVPTLLLYGDADVRSPKPVAEALHAGIPGSTLVYLPGVGHVSNLEAPEAFNAEVRGFLRSLGA